MTAPSPIHERLVAEVVASRGAQTRYFAHAMAELFRETEPQDPEACECEGACRCRAEYDEEVTLWGRAFNFKPDAWKIDDELGAVVCWEVNITSQPEHKTAHYIEAFWALDEIGWGLHLLNVDSLRVITPVDLLQAWSDRLKPSAAG